MVHLFLPICVVLFRDFGAMSKNSSQIWKEFYPLAHGIIFVVDASDEASLAESSKVLQQVSSDSHVKSKPFLIFVNKMDVNPHLSEQEITANLKLSDLKLLHWKLQFCSAATGEGLQDGIDFLAQYLNLSL